MKTTCCFSITCLLLVSISLRAEPPTLHATPEQIAEAKQLADDLGVVTKENAKGQVVLIDTAAKRSWVDDYQMEEMLVFPHLQSLTVEGPSITDALAPQIAKQKSLVSLAMRNTLISDAGIGQLRDLSSLKIIDLRLSPLVTDKSADVLSEIRSLKAVRMSGVNLTDVGIESFLKLAALTEVDVRNCRGVTGTGVRKLAGKTSLRMLKIGGPQIDNEVIKFVGTLKQLTGLSLDNCKITDDGIANLGALQLTDFTIYQSGKVTDEGLKVLANFGELKSLTLRDVPAKCASLERLPNPEKLRTLNVAQSGITDDQTPHLKRFSSLEKLILNETDLTDASVDWLAELNSLKYLEMTQTKISDTGVERLRKSLAGCTVRSN